ncbi:ComF family protein [Antrihabitans stalactiti]|nr:ComF family protein [Antrihabitans stalactiti]
MRTLLDLILPMECGGCAAAGVAWCPRCRAELAVEPIVVEPRVSPGVPCWALGRYSGPRRRAVLAAKERGRRDLAEPLGAALGSALDWLRREGELDPPELASLALVPAPTRSRAARMRGGDPVTRTASVAARALPRCTVAPVLGLAGRTRDSVGLTVDQRQRNLAGRVQLRSGSSIPPRANVVLLDDVITTGTTARESVRTLRRAGIAVTVVLVVASA